jgi:uncharacterized protein (TIGR03437 family)
MKYRFTLALSLIAAMPLLMHAQTTTTPCTAASLSGTYSLALNGRDIAGAVFSKDYEAVGTIAFDGVSGVTAALTATTNQLAGVSQRLTGTYAIPSNCVGTLNFASGSTASFTLVPYSSGSDFIIVGQDATYQYSGSGGPQPVACATSTLSGLYAFDGNGFSLASGAITGLNNISGVLEFDGAGAITGNWATATTGASVSDSISGNYTVSAGCTGVATVKDANGVAYTLSYTVTSANPANFAFDGVAAANMFSATAHSAFDYPGLAVANAAGVSGGTPPGSLFTIYGTGLASGAAQPVNFPLPTTLATATVTVNGEAAPLLYADKGQINAQMPFDTVPGMATVVVKTGTTTVSNSVSALAPATGTPGVFVYGSNHAVAQNFPAYDLNSSSSAAPAGSTIIVYFTGGGPVMGGSAVVTGHATPSAVFPLTESATATIGGTPAMVSFAGLTPGFVGLYQANIVIPNVAAGSHPMVITIGATASNTTNINTK